MPSYLALIRTDEGPGFSVEFPDLPGCLGRADSFPQASGLARDLLARHLAELDRRGLVRHEPRSMEELRASGLAEGGVPLLVPVVKAT